MNRWDVRVVKTRARAKYILLAPLSAKAWHSERLGTRIALAEVVILEEICSTSPEVIENKVK